MPKTKKKPDLTFDPTDRKHVFVRALAEYLTCNLAIRSIRLQMGDAEAKAWAKCWNASPLSGYPSAEEAEVILREFFA